MDLSTGTLSYSDLTNRHYSSNQSASVNANVGLTDAANPADPNQNTDVNLNSSSYTYQNESNQSLSKPMATVGEGNVTVGGEEAELAGLNRDTENTTNEIYDVDRQQGNIDVTVDHRLLSEEGRAQIAEDVEITADKVSDIASSIGEGVEEFTDGLGLTSLTDGERLELAEQINSALPDDLAALQLANADTKAQTKEQQLTTMASSIFCDDVDPNATVQVTSQTGEVISISYREVMVDFMSRGVDALSSFVDTVNDDSIQNVENQDVLLAAKDAAQNYLQTYNENKPLYDALENFASAPLIAKMVVEGVTDVAQATGILEKTAQAAGDLQGAAIASLQKLKAGFNKLTGSGAAKAADDKVDDVASSKGSQSPPTNNSNGNAGTGTVWDDITPTEGVYSGSSIPRSLEFSTGGETKVWVNPNATKHIAEYAQSVANNFPPNVVDLRVQEQLRSLQSAIKTATKDGIPYNERVTVDGWQLEIRAPRTADQLPTLVHARPVGSGG